MSNKIIKQNQVSIFLDHFGLHTVYTEGTVRDFPKYVGKRRGEELSPFLN